MGQMRCKQCGNTWSVSTKKSEAVISSNHAYLHPGHRTVTAWTQLQAEAKAS